MAGDACLRPLQHTLNRTMMVVRTILRKAANDWEWLYRAPAVRMLPEEVQSKPEFVNVRFW
ncbi:MAG: hypothetical protein V3V75_05840 [Thermoguttaceae bacterium]